MRTEGQPDGSTVWHFSREELQALLAHATTDETRFGMCGIGLDVQHGAATATDGHRAVKVWGERADSDLAIQPTRVLLLGRDAAETAVKTLKRRESLTIATCAADDPAVITIGATVTAVPLVNAAHPTVDYAMPKHEFATHTGVAAGVNPDYLADLRLVRAACPPTIRDLPRGKKEKIDPTLVLFPPVAPLGPWLGRLSCPVNATEWSVCIMPMRV